MGKLGDVIGTRRLFLATLLVFIAASFACGLAHDITQLVIARVVQGMGSAGIQIMGQTIIGHVASPRERPRYLSLVAASFPVAIVVGPVLGGLITDLWGWPWVFWINVPVGLIALALAAVAIPPIPPPGRRARFDFAGAVTLAVALIAIVLVADDIGRGPATWTVFALSIVAVLTFAAFFAIELRVTEPIVPIRAFSDRTIVASVALSAVIGAGLFSVVAYLPTYFQMAYHTTATVSGLVPIATSVGIFASNLTVGWFASRAGQYWIFPLVGTSSAAIGLLLMSLLPAGLPLAVPMLVMGLVGFCTGCFMSLIIAIVQSAVGRDGIGAITATAHLARRVGSTVGTATIGGFIGFRIAAQLPESMSAATLTPHIVRVSPRAVQAEVAMLYRDLFGPIFLALSGVYALGIVAAVILPAGRLSDGRSE